jgi:hypothetical protein
MIKQKKKLSFCSLFSCYFRLDFYSAVKCHLILKPGLSTYWVFEEITPHSVKLSSTSEMTEFSLQVFLMARCGVLQALK